MAAMHPLPDPKSRIRILGFRGLPGGFLGLLGLGMTVEVSHVVPLSSSVLQSFAKNTNTKPGQTQAEQTNIVNNPM